MKVKENTKLFQTIENQQLKIEALEGSKVKMMNSNPEICDVTHTMASQRILLKHELTPSMMRRKPDCQGQQAWRCCHCSQRAHEATYCHKGVLLIDGLTIGQLCGDAHPGAFSNDTGEFWSHNSMIMRGTRSSENCYIWTPTCAMTSISDMTKEKGAIWHRRLEEQ